MSEAGPIETQISRGRKKVTIMRAATNERTNERTPIRHHKLQGSRKQGMEHGPSEASADSVGTNAAPTARLLSQEFRRKIYAASFSLG